MAGNRTKTASSFGACIRSPAFAALSLLSACSADSGSGTLGLPSAADLNITATRQPETGVLIPQSGPIVGSPTEVYTRIARGALTCWFGAAGPLKARYIYHAEAEPPSKGGSSEIEIFAKEEGASDPRALRAYRVVISTAELKTKLEIENVKMNEPLLSRLNADVSRWAADEAGCGEAAVTAGWSAHDVPAAQAKPGKKGQPAAKAK
jgi:hypothetical protein